MKPLLSILIPTIHGREASLISLVNKITGFDHKAPPSEWIDVRNFYYAGTETPDGNVQIIWLKDNKILTIGEKRELLYKHGDGKYLWQIDDDDSISDDAIDLILKNIKRNADCVTFQEKCIINGEYYTSNHSLKYEDWGENQDGFDFVRTPFMKSVIKTEIARSVPIPHVRYGEDHEWAKALKPHLKNEVHIDKELYYYIHNSKPEDHNERYGIR